MIHFRSFDIIKILKISLPISITLSEKKKIPIIQQREERDGEQKEKERERVKVPSFIRNAVLRRTESESQRPFSPGQLVRRSCDIAWNSKAVDRMVEEGGEGGTQPWRVRGRATRIPKRGAALIYTSWAGSTTGRAV